MPHYFRCAHCARTLAVRNHRTGTAIACPNCGQSLVVPPPLPSLPHRRRHWAVGAVALSVAAFLTAVIVLLPRRPVQQPIAEAGPIVGASPLLPVSAPSSAAPVMTPARTVPAPGVVSAVVVSATQPRLASAPELSPRRPRPADPVRRVAAPARHLQERSEDDLQKEIAKVSEIALDLPPLRKETGELFALARQSPSEARQELTPRQAQLRSDLAGLPFRMGEECHLGPAAADCLEAGSLALREHLTAASQPASGAAAPGITPRPDAARLADALNANERHNPWRRPQAAPALVQLLMAENEGVREVLVEQLGRIEGKCASIALAQRALFDLNPGVRQAAIRNLRQRPSDEYRQTLLDGFRYPWPAVAEHAADALVALGLTQTAPALLALLDLPDPDQPYHKPGQDGAFVREVVRINHLRNCVLCHAASLATSDKVRGRLPDVTQPLPPPSSRQYYADNSGDFVRADITYLQQDFSVPLTVKNPGPWPAQQRFDFVVRERPAIPPIAPPNRQDGYHRAIFFALRELTGRDAGPTAQDWKRLFLGEPRVDRLAGKWAGASAVVADALGRVWVSMPGRIVRAREGSSAPLVEGHYHSLAADSAGNLLACTPLRVVAIEPDGKERVLAEKYQGQRLGGPLHLAADTAGGIYFTDTATDLTSGAVYYISPQRVLTRLDVPLKHPAGVAVAADGKTLYLRAAGAAEVMAYPLEGAGLPGKGRVFCRLPTASASDSALAVDAHGNVLAASAAAHSLYVFNTQGASMNRIPLPGIPQDCTAAADGRAVYVTTPTGISTVRFVSPIELAGR